MNGKHHRYVIIGGSAAGMSAAHVIRSQDHSSRVLVLTDEPGPAYYRPLIPFLISGKKKPGDLNLVGTGPYRHTDIEILTRTQVVLVNEREQSVTLKDGTSVAFDRLLIASGSRPLRPECTRDVDMRGVFEFRTRADAQAIADWVSPHHRAVLLGAGLANLKAAVALLDIGVHVTLVEIEDEILPWVMEKDAAILIRDALKNAGADMITGTTATELRAKDGRVCSVLLQNGRELSCDLFCVGIGVTPNTGFLEESGIETDQGLIVDAFTKTNLENVFAAGDVAVSVDHVTGQQFMSALWTHAVDMGRCAAYNMVGRPTPYAGALGVLNASQVGDVAFVAMGTVHTENTAYETHVSETEDCYRKLVFSEDGDWLIGAVFVGNIEGAGLYRSLIREKKPIRQVKSQLLNHTFHYGHCLRL